MTGLASGQGVFAGELLGQQLEHVEHRHGLAGRGAVFSQEELPLEHQNVPLLLAPVGALLVGTAVWLMQGSLLQWVGNLPGELMTEAGQVLAILCLGMLLKVFNMPTMSMNML